MASNTTYRAALTRKPQHIVAAMGVAWLFAFAVFGGPKPAKTPVYAGLNVTQPTAIDKRASLRPLRERFAVSLHEDDIALYEKAFSAQKNAQWQKADDALAAIQEPILRGAVLAERYLGPTYVTKYDELVHWLEHYADHPTATRIHALALRKQPNGVSNPANPRHTGKLKGYGTINGIGNASRPAGWNEAMRLYKEGSYSKASAQFTRSANRTKNHWYKAAAHFWSGRSADFAGDDSTAHYEHASRYAYTLYGTLARHSLGETLLQEAYAADTENSIYDHAAVARASAYHQLGMAKEAEAELRHLFVRANRLEREQLMHVAAALELPALQLRISQSLWYNNKRHHAGDYPLPTWELAERSAQTPMALLFAIARQESGFNANAQSRVGATGIMQLMPDTARYIIKKNRLNEVQVASANGGFPRSPFSVQNLNKPEINLAIGAHYVDYLADKNYIDNNLVYTLTAYNAGPGKLRKWKRELAGTNDPLLFIESLPYRETRHYVQQVLTNHVMYSLLEKGDTQTLDALTAGTWPSVYQ